MIRLVETEEERAAVERALRAARGVRFGVLRARADGGSDLVNDDRAADDTRRDAASILAGALS